MSDDKIDSHDEFRQVVDGRRSLTLEVLRQLFRDVYSSEQNFESFHMQCSEEWLTETARSVVKEHGIHNQITDPVGVSAQWDSTCQILCELAFFWKDESVFELIPQKWIFNALSLGTYQDFIASTTAVVMHIAIRDSIAIDWCEDISEDFIEQLAEDTYETVFSERSNPDPTRSVITKAGVEMQEMLEAIGIVDESLGGAWLGIDRIIAETVSAIENYPTMSDDVKIVNIREVMKRMTEELFDSDSVEDNWGARTFYFTEWVWDMFCSRLGWAKQISFEKLSEYGFCTQSLYSIVDDVVFGELCDMVNDVLAQSKEDAFNKLGSELA